MNESLSALYMRDPETAAILRRQAMAQQLARAQNPEIMYRSAASPWVAGLQALAGNLGSYMAERDLGDLSQRRNAEANEFMANALAGVMPSMGQGASPQPQQAPQGAPARMGGAAVPAGYVANTVAVENNPNRPDYTPDARNPRSSATGDGQFIDRTWMEFAAANPQRFQGMTRDQILAARGNPELSREAIGWYAQRNTPELQRAGVPVNDTTLALAHRFGPGDAPRVIQADPNTPMERIVSAQVMQANPDLQGRTAGQVVQQYGQRFGSGMTAAPQDAAPAASPQAPAQAGGLSRERLVMAAMQGMNSNNPVIAERSRQLLQMAQALPQREGVNYSFQNIGGTLYAVDPRNPSNRQVLGPAGRPEAGPAGPFGGTSMDAQNNNIVLSLADKIRNGTATREEQALYQRAYTSLSEGQLQFVADPSDPTGARQIAVRAPRSMGDLPAPPGLGGAPQQGGQPSAPAGTIPAQAGAADATAMPAVPGAVPGMERVAAPPAGFQRRPDGSLEPIPGGPQDQARQPLSEAQARANLFGTQMRQAEDILGRVQIPSGTAIAAWRSLPESAVNLALGRNDQQYFNALRLFAAGILRKETGAAFTTQELLDVQSRFFPMPGDSREVLEQKSRARQQAISAIQAEMPGGQFRGELPPPATGPQGATGQAGPQVIHYDSQGRRVR